MADTEPTEPRSPHPEDNPDVRHEHSDVNVRAILWFAGGLVVAGGLIHVGLWALFALFAESAPSAPPDTRPLAIGDLQRPPTPRLQALPWERDGEWAPPRVDLYEFRAAEDLRLHGYGWIDRDAGIVHIPIERAIEILARRGLPSRPETAGEAGPVVPVPTGSASGRDSRAIQTPQPPAVKEAAQEGEQR
jgi:hypothetical protein